MFQKSVLRLEPPHLHHLYFRHQNDQLAHRPSRAIILPRLDLPLQLPVLPLQLVELIGPCRDLPVERHKLLPPAPAHIQTGRHALLHPRNLHRLHLEHPRDSLAKLALPIRQHLFEAILFGFGSDLGHFHLFCCRLPVESGGAVGFFERGFGLLMFSLRFEGLELQHHVLRNSARVELVGGCGLGSFPVLMLAGLILAGACLVIMLLLLLILGSARVYHLVEDGGEDGL